MKEDCAPFVASKLVKASFDRRNVVHKEKEKKSLLNAYFSSCLLSVFI